MIVRNIGTGRTKVSGAGTTGRWRTVVPATLAVLLLILPSAFLFAEDASVVYMEGDPEVRTAAGATDWLDFGSVVRPGDSVVTGRWDFVELTQGAAATIRVDADTVFTIREVERDGRRETVMSNSVGSVSYRFQQVTGRAEPRVGTATTVAGVRGTELTVYAGADGSSMFLVETGEVEVTSAGQSVSLFEHEGVEVPAGQPPGEKFNWLGETIDFRQWESGNISRFLDEPEKGLATITESLMEFAEQGRERHAIYREVNERLTEERSNLREIEDEEEFVEFRNEVVYPLERQTAIAVLNYRYYALSALSLRRHVLGRMYMEMKTRYMLDRQNPVFVQFTDAFAETIQVFEEAVTPYLSENDI